MKALLQSKLIKLIIALAVCFIGVVFANQVNAATEEVVDSNNFKVTWEYEVQGGKAVNARITKVKNPSNQEIIPMEAENQTSEYGLTPALYEHSYCKIEVPSTLGGNSVISIGDGNNRIINPEGGNDNTYDVSVTEVVLPNSLQRINDHALENILNIDTINLPNSITYIGVKSFRNSLLTYGYRSSNLNLPASLQEIGESAFQVDACLPGGFYGIKGITINSNLTKIGKNAFRRQHLKYCRRNW